MNQQNVSSKQAVIPLPKNRRWINLLFVFSASLLTMILAFWTLRRAENELEANLKTKFTSILKIEIGAVREWMQTNQQIIGLLSEDRRLVELLSQPPSDQNQVQLQSRLDEILSHFGRRNCWVTGIDGVVITGVGQWEDLNSLLSAQVESTESASDLTQRPLSIVATNETKDQFAFIRHRVIDDQSNQLGTISVGLNLRRELGQVLGSSRVGSTGETVAFAPAGTIISDSRFQGRTREIGFLAELHRQDIALNQSAIRVNLAGIADQRNESVISASRWLPELGFGLVSKMDSREASAPLLQIRWFLWTFCGLLALTTLSALVYRYHLFRTRNSAQLAELAQQQLGPYRLEDKVGEGGMGVVFRAKHGLLRRPTAVKILPPEKSSQRSIERFEREVQFTSQLKHPNTIAIYDYGRTETGLFYYAMELLDGFNLDQLIRAEGPLSDGRTVHLLKQVCQSLREAHGSGLIHRDIKPANIMVCDQGGAWDMVKVLDFGMVRSQSHRDDLTEGLSGTPAYMAPEALIDPSTNDHGVDIFAIGAVGVFLLTGRPLFEIEQLSDLLRLHQSRIQDLASNQFQIAFQHNAARSLPCQRLLETILKCVASKRSERFERIDEVLTELDRCCPTSPWTVEDARSWWEKVSSETRDFVAPSVPTSSSSPNPNDALADTTTHIFEVQRSDRHFKHKNMQMESNPISMPPLVGSSG